MDEKQETAEPTETLPLEPTGDPEPIAESALGIVKTMPVTEVRSDLLICEWHVHHEMVERASVEGADDAQPGDAVLVWSDGSMSLRHGSPRPTEATRTIGAPVE